MVGKINITNEWKIIIAVVLIKLIVPFLGNSCYDHHIDGYFHATLANRIDAGYISVPPFIVIVSRLSILLFGHTDFALQLFPAIAGAIAVIFIGLSIKELGGGKIAILIGTVAFLFSPSFLRSNNFLTPNAFDQLSWIISSYLIIKMLKYNDSKYLVWLGLTFGIAFLNKYSVTFFGIAFFIAFLASSKRKLLLSKHFGIFILIFFAIISPNIWWQAKHNWPVFYHMNELYRTQLLNVHLSEFFTMQILMNLPTLVIWILGLFYLMFSKQLRRYKMFAFIYIIIIIEMIVLRGKFYYIIGIYGILLVAGAIAIEHLWNSRFKMADYAIIAIMLILGIFTLPFSIPFLNVTDMIKYGNLYKQIGIVEPMRWNDGKIHEIPHDYAIMTGSKELAETVNNLYSSLSVQEKKDCFIYAQSYGIASIISFFGNKIDIPEPVCYEDNFILWNKPTIDKRIMIYISYHRGEFLNYFNQIRMIDKVANTNSFLDGVTVYLCRSPSNEFYSYYQEVTEDMKNKFR